MNFRNADEIVEVAGEYVLGVLPQAEMDAVEREMLRNRELAAAVGFWRDKLLEIAPPPPAVTPPAQLWQGIHRQLRGTSHPTAVSRWWNSLHFWRFGGIAGLLATVLLSVYLVFTMQEQEHAAYLAVLQPPVSGTPWLVEIDGQAVRLRPLAPVELPPGRSVQFWTKPEGADAPTSLGLVAPDKPSVVATDRLPGLGPNQLFEVTLEPQYGSPTGRPTGQILAVGKAVRL
ncbi:MAG TPA: anti-sigma factor [Noviherbaspirillum sp.]|jgi:anti-sigma-K factor RskA|uniref:anti-sigma factor n=1 Tax=Noviherbaspirillum sp. TaxID=1926288 RepID=UPI002F94ACCB